MLAVPSNPGESPELSNLKTHLIKYLGLKDPTQIERAEFIEAVDLPSKYQEGYDFLNDNRLANTMIAIVPDDMWIKGGQPSESHAENNLILFKESYYKGNDEIGWMVHELAHCLRFKEAEGKYNEDSQTCAFEDIKSQYIYPNNRVEAYAFLQQFRYLKGKGKTCDDIIKTLKGLYKEEDFQFFNKLLDQAFRL